MRIHEFQTKQWLPTPLAGLFPFFADARNLDSLTPPWLQFQITTLGPVQMGEGTLIDYRLRVRGLPLRWRTRISVWQPPFRFVDEQLRGPYRRWIHEHTFESLNGGTLIRDNVSYAVPLNLLLHDWWVRPEIERIFRYRSEVLTKLLGSAAPDS